MPKRAPDLHVTQLAHRDDFRSPEIQACVSAALVQFGDKAEAEHIATIRGIVDLAEDPRAIILAGREDGEYVAFTIVILPDGDFHKNPFMTIWHCSGSPSIKRAMLDQVLAFLTSRGYNSCWVINRTGTPDSVWARQFRALGKARGVGSLVSFEVGGES